MTDVTNWTTKYTGVDEPQSGQYPVIIVEMNDAGRQVKKWRIGIYNEETANQVRARLLEVLTTGEQGAPLSQGDVENIKRHVADVN